MADNLILQSRPELRWGYSVQQQDTTPGSPGAPGHPIYAANDPDVMDNQAQIQVPLYYGAKYVTTDEIAEGRLSPYLNGLEFPLNAYSLLHPARSLTQYGAKTGSVGTVSDAGQMKPVIAGTTNVTLGNPDGAFTLAAARSFESGSRKAQAIYGAVVRTLNIMGEDGGIWRASYDLIGMRFVRVDLAPANAAPTTYGKIWPVTLFKGGTSAQKVAIWYDLSGTPTEVLLPMRSYRGGWTNNAEAVAWSTNLVQAIGFGDGRIIGTGELRIACDPDTATAPGEDAIFAAWRVHTPLGFAVTNCSGPLPVDTAGEFELRHAFILTSEPLKQLGPAGIYELVLNWMSVYVSATWPSFQVQAHDGTTFWY